MKDDLAYSFFRVAGLTVIQVSVFVLFYEAIVETYGQYVSPMNKIFGFGMQVNYSIVLLTILAGLNAIAQVFANQIRIRFATAILAAAVWIFYWGNIAVSVPNRFLMLSGLGMMSLMVGVLFMFPEIEVRVELK